MTMAVTTGRRQRSDGVRTRESIVAAAAALATIEGIDRISIGGLAEHIGISKSGLFAHFRSKEALQLATIEHASEVFDIEVVDRARDATPGRTALLALLDAYFDHLERRVFPGGCFFAATVAEMHMRPGQVTDRLDAFVVYWLGLLRAQAVMAIDNGEVPADEDPDQLVYDLESHVLHAHFAFPTGGPVELDRARRAVRHRLGVPPGR
jgi:AcrR family transcriptional regulator